MVRFTIICVIVIVILVVNESQKCYCPNALKSCTNEIKAEYGARNKKRPGAATIKFYAQCAIKYKRISDNPAFDTFFVPGSTRFSLDHARAYYVKLRTFIKEGSEMQSPTLFCQYTHMNVNDPPFEFIEPHMIPYITDPNIRMKKSLFVYSTCISQITLYQIPITDNLLDVLYYVYNNIVLTQIHQDHEYVRFYVEHVANTIKIKKNEEDNVIIQNINDFCTERLQNLGVSLPAVT